MSTTYIPAELRRLVYERARGRCEYCLIPETVVLVSHQVDHIIAEKHGGLTEADNLALSCACNKHKGVIWLPLTQILTKSWHFITHVVINGLNIFG